ncbi:MAG: PINc protein [Dehalococcoidia bacterium]|nr:PINc protein [Dehalococcoidia bacterium]
MTLLVSPLVLEETTRNLAGKAPEALPAFQILRQVLSTTSVNPPRRLVLRVAQVVAVKDAPIIAAGMHSRASYLATYDRRHLLSIREDILAHFGIEVATPEEILSRLQ